MKVVDIIEDMGVGLFEDQLAKQPKEVDKDGLKQKFAKENRKKEKKLHARK